MYKDEFFIRWNYHLLAQPGYVVLMTNYTGSTGFGEEFAQGIQGDSLEGPAAEINQAADEAIRRYPFIDASRQAAGWASYGGHLANWLAVSTTRYRALVSHAGLFDLKTQWTTSDIAWSRERNLGGPAWEDRPVWRRQSPFWHSAKLKTPILVTFGERDFRVPYNNGLEFWTVLQRQQVESRLPRRVNEQFERIYWVKRKEVKAFFDAGGGRLITLGTDHPSWGEFLSGFGAHRELHALVLSGIPPAAALKIGTINGARAMNVASTLGTLEPGKIADLFVVGGNPLQDIRNTRNVKQVMKGGELFDAPALLASVKGKMGPKGPEDEKPWKPGR